MKKTPSKSLAEIRRRAEALAAHHPPEYSPSAVESLKRLLDDLSLHRIELEQQNEELRQVQLRLEETHRKYLHLFEFAPVAYLVLDAHGRIRQSNPKLAEMLGIPRGRLARRAFWSFVHKEDRELFYEHCRRVLEVPQVQTCELRLKTQDGVPLYVQMQSQCEPEDQERGIHMVLLDISPREEAKAAMLKLERAFGQLKEEIEERKRAEESEERLRALMDNNPSLVFLKDDTGRYVYLNNAYETEFVHTKDWLGKTDFDFWPRESAELFRANDEKVLESGKTHQFLEDSKDLTGARCCWLCYKFPFADSSGRKYLGGIGINATDRVQAEEALQASEDRLRQALEAGQVYTFEWDPGTDQVLRSANCRSILGWTTDATRDTGKKYFMRVHPEDHDEFLCLISGLSPAKPDYEVKYRYMRPVDSRQVILKETGRAVFDHAGKMVSLHGLVRDVTSAARVEEALRASEERYRMLHESLRDAFVMVAMDGRILEFNDVFCQMLGYSPEELRTLTYVDLTPEQWHAMEADIVREQIIPRGYSDVYEKEYRRKDGILIRVEFRTILSRDASGQPNAMWAIVRDITERKQIEVALRAANAELIEADRSKDEFLAMLAHELRNPLAPVRSAAEILNRHVGDNPVLRRQGALLDRQIGHMTRLLDDLLDVSRITRGRIEIRNKVLDLRVAVRDGAEACWQALERKRHQLQLDLPDEPLWVMGDRVRLEQIFSNLLGNACKYMPPGGRIHIAASRESAGLNQPFALVRVRDWGIGMAPDLLTRAFELFVQGERGLERSQGGLGIGLTLVRRLIELHGGTIEARSEGLGRGSEFIVRLPLVESPEEDVDADGLGDAEAAVSGENPASLKILVVDDIVDTAGAMAELLEMDGHQVRVALDGSGTLEAARDFRPDLILLDIGLPGMNGYDVARHLRREGYSTTLVALTGYGQETDRRMGLEAGFDHYMVKPVDLAALRKLLSQVPVIGR